MLTIQYSLLALNVALPLDCSTNGHLFLCFLYKALQKENGELRDMLNVVHEQLEIAMSANKVQKQNLETLNARLDGFIQGLVTIHREITHTLQT